MSEQDWQATVLAELGVPLSGLMTPETDARPAPAAAREARRAAGGEAAAEQAPGGPPSSASPAVPARPGPSTPESPEPPEPQAEPDVWARPAAPAPPPEAGAAPPAADEPAARAHAAEGPSSRPQAQTAASWDVPVPAADDRAEGAAAPPDRAAPASWDLPLPAGRARPEAGSPAEPAAWNAPPEPERTSWDPQAEPAGAEPAGRPAEDRPAQEGPAQEGPDQERPDQVAWDGRPPAQADPPQDTWPLRPSAPQTRGRHAAPQAPPQQPPGQPSSGQQAPDQQPSAQQPPAPQFPAQEPPAQQGEAWPGSPPAPGTRGDRQDQTPAQDAAADRPERSPDPWPQQAPAGSPLAGEAPGRPPAGQPPAGEPPGGQAPDAWLPGQDEAAQASWDLAARSQWGPADPAQEEGGRPARDDRAGGGPARRPPDQGPTPYPPSSGIPPVPGPRAPSGPMAANDLVRRAAHGDPLVRRMSRSVRRAVGVSAADEVRRAVDVEAVLNRPVPSCRQIAVTSIRGGAGKTTVAGLTATVISQYRQDRVLAVDADSGLGSLPLRLGVAPERSLHDLARALPQTFDEVTGYLARTAGGLWVLSGTARGRIAGELELPAFRAALGTMTRYFATAVVDCGAGLLPELQRGILSDSHAQIMVTPGTVDGALSAQGALEWQVRNGYEYLLGRTVIAFVTHTPHVDSDIGRAARMLSADGLPVVHIPYDRHLAVGTAVESARIGHETRAAMIRIAVEAFARAASV